MESGRNARWRDRHPTFCACAPLPEGEGASRQDGLLFPLAHWAIVMTITLSHEALSRRKGGFICSPSQWPGGPREARDDGRRARRGS